MTEVPASFSRLFFMAILSTKINARLKDAPRLRLLLEREPAHSVFLGNLTDLVLRRPVPFTVTTSRPAPFWSDVFIDSKLPWRSFFESVLYHLGVIAVLCSLSTPRLQPQFRSSRQSSVVYYPPPNPKFPARESRRAPDRPRPPQKQPSPPAHEAALKVTPGQKHMLYTPPDIKIASRPAPKFLSASRLPLPMPPTSSSLPLSRQMQTPPSAVVAPPADVHLATTREARLSNSQVVPPAPDVSSLTASKRSAPQPGSSVIAPAPEIRSVAGSRRGVAQPNVAVVAPAPNVQIPVNFVGSMNIGRAMVVAPAPKLSLQEQRAASGRGLPSLRDATASVIAPSPSVKDAVTHGGGRDKALGSGAMQVVPPAPSLQAGNSGTARNKSLSSGTGQVVPPAPTRGDLGMGGILRPGQMPGGGVSVVGPAPSGALGGSAAGRAKTLSAGIGQVVPPAPGSGGAISSRENGHLGMSGSSQVVPPAPSPHRGLGKSGSSGRSGALSAAIQSPLPPQGQASGSTNVETNVPMDIPEALAPPAPDMPDNLPREAPEELPVRVLGLVLSLPGSSYFSNYEVLLAEKQVKEGGTQLIKLVYESLPYQRRLAEYGTNYSKVYRLRITRDDTCDESLIDMTWPEKGKSHDPMRSRRLSAADRKGLLPCYRTTADDYRRAIQSPH